MADITPPEPSNSPSHATPAQAAPAGSALPEVTAAVNAVTAAAALSPSAFRKYWPYVAGALVIAAVVAGVVVHHGA